MCKKEKEKHIKYSKYCVYCTCIISDLNNYLCILEWRSEYVIVLHRISNVKLYQSIMKLVSIHVTPLINTLNLIMNEQFFPWHLIKSVIQLLVCTNYTPSSVNDKLLWKKWSRFIFSGCHLFRLERVFFFCSRIHNN